MAPLAGGNSLVEVFRPENDLPGLTDRRPAIELDAELFPHGAGTAIAAHQVSAAQLFLVSVEAQEDGDTVITLLEVDELTAVAYARIRRSLSDFRQQRLKLVLRHQLIGLKREGTVAAFGDLLAPFRP